MRAPWRPAVACVALMRIFVIINCSLTMCLCSELTLTTNTNRRSSARTAPQIKQGGLPRRTEQYGLRKLRKQKIKTVETIDLTPDAHDMTGWEEDDDDDIIIPFRSDNGDATATESNSTYMSNAQNILSVVNTSTLIDENDAVKHNVTTLNESKGNEQKKDEGIIYTKHVGPKESKLQPPPPSRKPAENTTELQQNDGKEDTHIVDANKESQNNKKDPTTDQLQPKSHSAETSNIDSLHPSDTIFDDLLRGFGFASLFCLLVFCVYRCCHYICIRCGVCVDERVTKARWRRVQLKKKKQYRKKTNIDEEDMPPLDTRKWAKWMAKRERAEQGCDGFDYSSSNRLNALDDNLDVSSRGESVSQETIEFDCGELEMAKVSYGDDAELEYGEGDALEDESHDSRLFDAEDHGRGVEKEAEKFFTSNRTDKECRKNKRIRGKQSDGHGNESVTYTTDERSKHQHTPENNDIKQNQNNDVSCSSCFDALQTPSREINHTNLGSNQPENNNNIPAAKESTKNPQVAVADLLGAETSDLLGNGYISDSASAAATNEDVRAGDSNKNHDDESTNSDLQLDVRSSLIAAAENTGYDEETDLLGLRTESPPPLDLEKIEKNLMENMEKATFYL